MRKNSVAMESKVLAEYSLPFKRGWEGVGT